MSFFTTRSFYRPTRPPQNLYPGTFADLVKRADHEPAIGKMRHSAAKSGLSSDPPLWKPASQTAAEPC